MLTACVALLLYLPQDPLPPEPQPTPRPVPAIRLPLLPEPSPPAPRPEPVEPVPITELPADRWYVIDSDVQIQVYDSPLGIVSIDRESGPIRLRGKFVDGRDVETRVYQGPYVYIVEAAAKQSPVGARKSGYSVPQTFISWGRHQFRNRG